MKKLPLPDYDDTALTTTASQNRRMTSSYPYLQNELQNILSGFNQYHLVTGNAWNVLPIPISDNLKAGLKVHYKSEPKCFPFIPEIRDSSRRVCPMCGSLGAGTLDHLLPQAHHPEFAVYSKNLVPACACNSKRKDHYKGTVRGVRVLHPYYDDCLSDRQISFSITPITNYPLVKFDLIYLNPNDANFDSIKFHVEKVVLPSGIEKEMDDMWASLSEYPFDKIHTLPEFTEIDMTLLNQSLESSLRRNDRQKGTPNNWESIFIHSILNDLGAKTWIVQKHNSIVDS